MGNNRISTFFHQSFFIMLSLFVVLGYNNCAESPSESSGNTELSSLSTTSGATGEFSLVVNSSDPMLIRSTDISFNVGGPCNSGSSFGNRIEWELKDVNGTVSYLSQQNWGVCDKGRFFVYVPLDFQSFDFTKLYVLNLKMLAFDDRGASLGEAEASIGIATSTN